MMNDKELTVFKEAAHTHSTERLSATGTRV